MSYSPSSRVRRNSIFSDQKKYKMVRSSVQPSTPSQTELIILRDKLTAVFQEKAQALMDQIRDNTQTIRMLEYKLEENENQLSKRKYMINERGFSVELIEELIQGELNKRLSIVSKKFAEMEDAFVVSMFPTSQQAVVELAPENKNFMVSEPDIMKLKGQMDERLNEMLVSSNSSKELIAQKCWEINEQIRINEEVIESMNGGIENIRSKIFSLESLLRSIQTKGEEFKTVMNGRVEGLKEELNRVTVGILNVENRLGNPMMKKREAERNEPREVFEMSSRMDASSSREFEEVRERYEQVMNRQNERERDTIREMNTVQKESRVITSIKDFRREVLNKDSISEISSISSSMSFLPQPIYIPKTKTQPSNRSSPDSKPLAKTKITNTLPLKPSPLPTPTQFLQDSADEFLDLYRQSSLQLTKQIMSPFQQAEYISQHPPNPLDNTKSALTVPLLKPQLHSSIEERVRETIFRKNLKAPIGAYLDSNNYVKKANGAYLFDYDGDVLKCSGQEFKKLCGLRIFVEK